jgi:hypothetical protein
MSSVSRHQCLIYSGSPSRHLRPVATVIREKLGQNHRCLYLNSKPMVAGMRSYLASEGVDVEREQTKGALILSSDQQHLIAGRFEVDQMIRTLEAGLNQALHDGFVGLWATGDMTWELGPDKNFSKLVEYEYRLEEFMREHSGLGGICQYHTETLPPTVVRQGILLHQSIFVNQTLSLLNPHYDRKTPTWTLDYLIARLVALQQQGD